MSVHQTSWSRDLGATQFRTGGWADDIWHVDVVVAGTAQQAKLLIDHLYTVWTNRALSPLVPGPTPWRLPLVVTDITSAKLRGLDPNGLMNGLVIALYDPLGYLPEDLCDQVDHLLALGATRITYMEQRSGNTVELVGVLEKGVGRG